MNTALVKKVLSLPMTLVFTSQVCLGALAEATIWEERRQKKNITLAALPASSPLLLPTIQKSPLTPSRRTNLLKKQHPLVEAIPQNAGTIRHIHQAKDKNAPQILLIQDVHLNPEAQKNIAAILESVLTKTNIDYVGVEGAFDPFDFTPFQAFQNKDKVRDVADSFLNAKLLAAPSYVGMTNPTGLPPFIGIDSKPHYKANVKAYLESRRHIEEVASRLKQEEGALTQKKQIHLNPRLQKLDALMTAYHKDTLDLGPYVKKLALHSKKSPRPKSIHHFLEAYELETSLNFTRVNQQRQRVIEKLSQSLSKEEQSSLLAQSVAYRMGRLSFGAYYQGLKTLCQQNQIDLTKYPAFHDYIRYVILSDGINVDDLFFGMEQLEESVLAEHIKTEKEAALIRQSQHLYLTQKLIRFELTPREWEKYKTISNFQFSIFNQFSSLDSQTNISLKIDHQEFIENRKLKIENSILVPFVSFYQEADIRSEKMVENLTDGKNIALITGGFHSPHMVDLLKKKGASILVVSPKLTKVDTVSSTSYLSVFEQEKTPLDQLFKGDKLFVSPHTVHTTYKPFLFHLAARTWFSLTGRRFFSVHSKKAPHIMELEPGKTPNQDKIHLRPKPLLASFWAEQSENKWGKNSWPYWLINGIGANFEIVFQLLIPGLAFLLGPVWALGLIAFVHSTLHPGVRGTRFWRNQKFWYLFVVSVSLGIWFVMPFSSIWTPIFIATGIHTAHNFLVMTLDHFGLLPKWMHLASTTGEDENKPVANGPNSETEWMRVRLKERFTGTWETSLDRPVTIHIDGNQRLIISIDQATGKPKIRDEIGIVPINYGDIGDVNEFDSGKSFQILEREGTFWISIRHENPTTSTEVDYSRASSSFIVGGKEKIVSLARVRFEKEVVLFSDQKDQKIQIERHAGKINLFLLTRQGDGDFKKETIPFEMGQPLIVGRDEPSDIRLNFPHVSRQHIKITIDKWGGSEWVYLEDLRSLNGTRVSVDTPQLAVEKKLSPIPSIVRPAKAPIARAPLPNWQEGISESLIISTTVGLAFFICLCLIQPQILLHPHIFVPGAWEIIGVIAGPFILAGLGVTAVWIAQHGWEERWRALTINMLSALILTASFLMFFVLGGNNVLIYLHRPLFRVMFLSFYVFLFYLIPHALLRLMTNPATETTPSVLKLGGPGNTVKEAEVRFKNHVIISPNTDTRHGIWIERKGDQVRLLMVRPLENGENPYSNQNEIPFDYGEPIVVGRAFDSNISLSDREASRSHVQFSIHPDRVSIKDLDSSNGSTVFIDHPDYFLQEKPASDSIGLAPREKRLPIEAHGDPKGIGDLSSIPDSHTDSSHVPPKEEPLPIPAKPVLPLPQNVPHAKKLHPKAQQDDIFVIDPDEFETFLNENITPDKNGSYPVHESISRSIQEDDIGIIWLTRENVLHGLKNGDIIAMRANGIIPQLVATTTLISDQLDLAPEASYFANWSLKRWGKNTWQYWAINAGLANIEIGFQLFIPTVAFFFGSSWLVLIGALGLSAFFFSAFHPGVRGTRFWKKQRFWYLFGIGLLLGGWFVIPFSNLWIPSFIATGLHTAHNLLVMTLDHFGLLPKWMHIASTNSGSLDRKIQQMLEESTAGTWDQAQHEWEITDFLYHPDGIENAGLVDQKTGHPATGDAFGGQPTPKNIFVIKKDKDDPTNAKVRYVGPQDILTLFPDRAAESKRMMKQGRDAVQTAQERLRTIRALREWLGLPRETGQTTLDHLISTRGERRLYLGHTHFNDVDRAEFDLLEMIRNNVDSSDRAVLENKTARQISDALERFQDEAAVNNVATARLITPEEKAKVDQIYNEGEGDELFRAIPFLLRLDQRILDVADYRERHNLGWAARRATVVDPLFEPMTPAYHANRYVANQLLPLLKKKKDKGDIVVLDVGANRSVFQRALAAASDDNLSESVVDLERNKEIYDAAPNNRKVRSDVTVLTDRSLPVIEEHADSNVDRLFSQPGHFDVVLFNFVLDQLSDEEIRQALLAADTMLRAPPQKAKLHGANADAFPLLAITSPEHAPLADSGLHTNLLNAGYVPVLGPQHVQNDLTSEAYKRIKEKYGPSVANTIKGLVSKLSHVVLYAKTNPLGADKLRQASTPYNIRQGNPRQGRKSPAKKSSPQGWNQDRILELTAAQTLSYRDYVDKPSISRDTLLNDPEYKFWPLNLAALSYTYPLLNKTEQSKADRIKKEWNDGNSQFGQDEVNFIMTRPFSKKKLHSREDIHAHTQFHEIRQTIEAIHESEFSNKKFKMGWRGATEKVIERLVTHFTLQLSLWDIYIILELQRLPENASSYFSETGIHFNPNTTPRDLIRTSIWHQTDYYVIDSDNRELQLAQLAAEELFHRSPTNLFSVRDQAKVIFGPHTELREGDLILHGTHIPIRKINDALKRMIRDSRQEPDSQLLLDPDTSSPIGVALGESVVISMIVAIVFLIFNSIEPQTYLYLNGFISSAWEIVGLIAGPLAVSGLVATAFWVALHQIIDWIESQWSDHVIKRNYKQIRWSAFFINLVSTLVLTASLVAFLLAGGADVFATLGPPYFYGLYFGLTIAFFYFVPHALLHLMINPPGDAATRIEQAKFPLVRKIYKNRKQYASKRGQSYFDKVHSGPLLLKLFLLEQAFPRPGERIRVSFFSDPIDQDDDFLATQRFLDGLTYRKISSIDLVALLVLKNILKKKNKVEQSFLRGVKSLIKKGLKQIKTKREGREKLLILWAFYIRAVKETKGMDQISQFDTDIIQTLAQIIPELGEKIHPDLDVILDGLITGYEVQLHSGRQEFFDLSKSHTLTLLGKGYYFDHNNELRKRSVLSRLWHSLDYRFTNRRLPPPPLDFFYEDPILAEMKTNFFSKFRGQLSMLPRHAVTLVYLFVFVSFVSALLLSEAGSSTFLVAGLGFFVPILSAKELSNVFRQQEQAEEMANFIIAANDGDLTGALKALKVRSLKNTRTWVSLLQDKKFKRALTQKLEEKKFNWNTETEAILTGIFVGLERRAGNPALLTGPLADQDRVLAFHSEATKIEVVAALVEAGVDLDKPVRVLIDESEPQAWHDWVKQWQARTTNLRLLNYTASDQLIEDDQIAAQSLKTYAQRAAHGLTWGQFVLIHSNGLRINNAGLPLGEALNAILLPPVRKMNTEHILTILTLVKIAA